MALYVVATPIGDPNDITLRAQEILRACSLVIGEEKRETEILLKKNSAWPKDVRLLNEHSDLRDLNEIVDFCRHQDAALVSDCGTPGFCDPGAELVGACRAAGVRVASVAGASSLMSFISVCGVRIDQFFFRGFLPRESDEREKSWREIKSSAIPSIIMETPYRLKKVREELALHVPDHRVIVGLDLTMAAEALHDGRGRDVLKNLDREKGEFLMLILPIRRTAIVVSKQDPFPKKRK